MCCSLEQSHGKLIIQSAALEKNRKDQEKTLHLKAIYDRTPQTLADRISRFFLRIELLEKIAEIADEFFHLFGSVFQRYTNLMVYQTLRHLHHASHDIEHVLHSFCLAGDITALLSRKFCKYHDPECQQIDYLRTLSRICHTTAHLFNSLQFLHELKLCSLEKFEKSFKYIPLFSAMGYLLWSISLVWQRHKGIANEQFSSEMGIHLGGGLFETIPLANRLSSLAPYSAILNKAAALAGIIHAWCVVQHLLPKDQEVISVHVVLPQEKKDQDNKRLVSTHHHGADCC